jgi:hypothetical protein
MGANVEILSKDKDLKLKIINSTEFSFNGELNLEKILGDQSPKLCAVNFYTN